MAGLVGQLIGGLLATFLLSRLLLWATRTWAGGVTRYLVAHSLSLALAALIGGMGMANGGAFAPMAAAAIYAIPQLFWLAVDLWRFQDKRSRLAEADDAEAKPSSRGHASIVILVATVPLVLGLGWIGSRQLDSARLSSSSTADSVASSEPELLLDCAGVSGSPSEIMRLRQGGAHDPFSLASETRVVLRVIPENMDADWTDTERRVFVITDRAPVPSPLVATIGSCAYVQCEMVIDADQIWVRAVIPPGMIAPEGVRHLRISRSTGDYSASVNLPRRPVVGEPGLQLEEFGTCAPRARQF